MTRTILVAGTASHVGKSTVAAGLCRLLARRGLSVAPFKAQNMSNNARAVVSSDGGYGEIGVSQYVQARAAGVTATTDMNPVLLKPRGDGESQLVIRGEARRHHTAGDYYENHWDEARAAAERSYRRLARDHDVVVAEGAGSVGEINLHDRDLANVETARFSDATVLLVGDIERGGVFASLYGTLELAPGAVRDRVAGTVINKFRGDRTLLEPGIEDLESRTGVPVLGVLPYDDPGLPAEDSVSLPPEGERAVHGADDAVADDRAATIAVPRFPRISNFTDFEPLSRRPGVRVAYVPLSDHMDHADAVVLPGTKNTVDDLLACRRSGFADALADFPGPVVGICGGYQMLGETIENADVEGTGDRETVEGLGFLPVETIFSNDKRVEAVTRDLSAGGPLADPAGTVAGYEIHMGDSTPVEPLPSPVGPDSAATDRVLGTYLHGLFENANAREAFVRTVFERAGIDPPDPDGGERSPYDRAADLVAEGVDLDPLDLPVGNPVRH